MGVPVLVLGESGSGKSFSIHNFNPEEVGIFAVEKDRLPFPNGSRFKIAKNADYSLIFKTLENPKLKAYVIDDSQYLMSNELFDKAKDAGYGKFTDIALHFRNLIHIINHKLPDDVIVYFLHHVDQDTQSGKIKAKTVGKMLDNQLTVEGCFNIVLLAAVEGTEHYFVTQSDGSSTAKTPYGMFSDIRIPNDLKSVDTAIRNYWNLEGDDNDSKTEN